MEVTDEIVARLQDAWKEHRGERLTATKARRRLEGMVALGCPVLGNCTECEKVRNCPLLAEEGVENG